MADTNWDFCSLGGRNKPISCTHLLEVCRGPKIRCDAFLCDCLWIAVFNSVDDILDTQENQCKTPWRECPSFRIKPSVFVSTGAWCAIKRAEAPSSHLTRLSLLLIPAPNLGVRLLRQSKAGRQRQTRTKSSSVVLFIPRCLLPPSLHLTFPIRHSFSICQSHSLLFPPRLARRLPTGGPLVSSACFLTQLHSMLTHKTYYHAS